MMDAEARVRVSYAIETRATGLDLSSLQISRLRDEIRLLTSLKTINLSGCWQVVDLSPLQSLTALTSLDLSRCGKVIDLSSLQSLTALTSLGLSDFQSGHRS